MLSSLIFKALESGHGHLCSKVDQEVHGLDHLPCYGK